MKKNFLLLFALLLMAFSTALADEQPIIWFHTNAYVNDGATNAFSFQIGSTEKSMYIDVDCGFGKTETEISQAVLDSTEVKATLVECTVSKDGIVKIYGEASKIDYFNASGCAIDDIHFCDSLQLEILNLEHNELLSLDLSSQPNIQALYLYDNTFSKAHPLMLGYMPKLVLLDIGQVGYLSEEFTLHNFPMLTSFDAYHCLTLKKAETDKCPSLVRLSMEMAAVEKIDLSNNPKVQVLNVNNTRVKSLDVSNCPHLVELYCSHTSGTINTDVKMDTLDLTHNSELYYLFCGGNNLKTLDISKNPILFTLSASDNQLSNIDITNNTQLYSVNLRNNNMDYATLPLDPGTWNEYYYGQREMPVAKSFKEGDVLDLSARVLRDGTTTNGVLYRSPAADPTSAVALDTTYYTYEKGKITLLKACSDSLYVQFDNTAFSDASLYTTRFMVKSASEAGQPSALITFSSGESTGKAMNLYVGIDGASATNPKEFYVDFGDGEMSKFTATTDTIPATANVVGTRTGYANAKIYANEGDQVSAFKVADFMVTGIQLTKAGALKYLALPNTQLYSIDLTYNRSLRSLDLSSNNLSTITLKGTNGYFYKSMLHDVNLSHNKLSTLTFDDMYALHNVNLSYNQFKELDFSDADNLVTVDLSNNLFESLTFNYSSVMTHLNVANCNLSSLYIPEDNSVQYLDVTGNKFTYATLPALDSLDDAHYLYAPQQKIKISSKGIGVDLTEQNVTKNGSKTVYTWKKTDGTALTEGTDYTITDGYTKFINTTVGKIYCELTHAGYPEFTGTNVLATTEIQPIDKPTNLVATFTTTKDDEEVELSLASVDEDVSLYFDWNGDGNLVQYPLTTTYTLFSATTKAGVNVKAYTSSTDEKVKVFSINGATMSNFNAVNLGSAFNITVNSASLDQDSIVIPASNSLGELNLSGNNIKSFDFSKYPNLIYANMCSNQLESLDLSALEGLQVAYFDNNKLTNIKVKNNNLWGLSLSSNQFTGIDLAGAPNLQQLGLAGNQLSSISLDSFKGLMVVNLSSNKFTFKTLPLPRTQWTVYYYSNQAQVPAHCRDQKVDLSDQAVVADTATVYRWFLDEVTLNDDGVLEGEELNVNEEYTVTGGVTTFTTTLRNVQGVMTNSLFPNLYLFTPLIDVAALGDVNCDGVVNVSDATALNNYILGDTTYSFDLCDINGDGEVNVSDLTMLIQMILAQ